MSTAVFLDHDPALFDKQRQALREAHILRSQLFRCLARKTASWIVNMALSRLRINRWRRTDPCACLSPA